MSAIRFRPQISTLAGVLRLSGVLPGPGKKSPDLARRRPGSARSRVAGAWWMLAASWSCLVAAWRVLAGGPVHPLARPERGEHDDQADHPAWCGRESCDAARSGRSALEWSHALMTTVEVEDDVADTYLLRMDSLEDGEHHVCERVVVTADGSMTAEQAEAFGLALLQASRQLAAGLEGLPGGVARAQEMARTGAGRNRLDGRRAARAERVAS